ncbi:hypothetical protein [Microcoleus sp. FACHB-672]|uniref:hypothetical protein n=1 Tax=Microcoleus sp. FACHB-672 TaxID=2692825 RepID=UPI0016887226|nr:hypothetical protein [Microcoleus sp. FACHB-672]MBD2042429.1 hypothetical protein [Microcoleus sp. FACHB-672]
MSDKTLTGVPVEARVGLTVTKCKGTLRQLTTQVVITVQRSRRYPNGQPRGGNWMLLH